MSVTQQKRGISPSYRSSSDPMPPSRVAHDTVRLEHVRRVRHRPGLPSLVLAPPTHDGTGTGGETATGTGTTTGKTQTAPYYTYQYDPTPTAEAKTFQRTPYAISAWHDLPVTVYDPSSGDSVDDYVNGITIIPKWTRHEYYMKKNALNTPIEPVKDDKQGGIKQLQYGDMLFNYGILPQTWSDPDHTYEIEMTITVTNASGTRTQPQKISHPGNDEPLSYIDLGTQQRDVATVSPIKILGCLPLIDASMNVMDFKLIGIYYADALADQMDDIDDVNRVLPGALDSIQQYFIHYREPEGKQPNSVAGSDYMSVNDAWRLINTGHNAWHKHFRQRRSTDSKHWHKSI